MRFASVLLCLVFPAAAAAQHKLEAKHGSAGDRTQIKIESTIDLSITKKDSDGEKTTTFTIVKSEAYRQTVKTAENGAGITLIVDCTLSELQRSGSQGDMQKGNTELHGKSFLVSRLVGQAVKVEMSDGSPAAIAGVDSVGGWEDYVKLLPGKEVAEKGQWLIEKDVSALVWIANLAETKSAQIVATLDKVEGTRARIEFEGTVEGKTKDGSMVKLAIPKGKGEMIFDTATGRPVSIAVAGEFEMIKDVIHIYQKPGTHVKIPEKVGEIRTRSSKLEVKLTFE